jgi:hypothetical protein
VQSRQGRLNDDRVTALSRPYGTKPSLRQVMPTDKSVGYYQSSLPGLGDGVSSPSKKSVKNAAWNRPNGQRPLASPAHGTDR